MMAESQLGVYLQPFNCLRDRVFLFADSLLSKINKIPVLESFPALISSNGLSQRGIWILCATGGLYACGMALSKFVLNNWTSDKWDWTREVILITGGSSGIGERMASMFASRNIQVVILDITSPKDSPPQNVRFYKCDITSPDAIQDAARRIREDVGNPSIVINNAGIGTAKSLLVETNEETQRTFDVNNVAHFWIVREFLPHMIQRNHGHIVTVASMASFMTLASNVSYSCTKAAAVSFHEGLAQELRHRYYARKVRTSVIHPTWVRTPLIERLLESGRWNSRTIEADIAADGIVSHVLKGESGQVFIPAGYGLATLVKALPSWLQESIRSSQSGVLQIDS